MKIKIVLVALIGTACFIMCFCAYQWGKSTARTEVITQQVEVIKYVEKQKSKIYSRPNAHRDELLKRMRAGDL